jgi:tetratricopeptide (TPR) repeat protein
MAPGMKRRLVAACLVLAAGAGAAVAYTAAARDREYRRLIAAGEAALAARQTSTAIEAFSGAVALKPDAMLAHLKRGETYRRQGDLRAALRDLRAAAELDPSATRPLEPLGDVTLELQRPELAAERYAAYVRLDDRSPRVLYKLALSHYRAGNPAEALTWIHRALALDAGLADAHYLLGLCLSAERQTTRARRALERAVALDAGHIPAREALAALHRAAGRHADAAEHLEAVAALDRADPRRLIALGLEYADARRTDLAVATLGRAAERFPQNVQVYAALGAIWLRVAEETGDRVALGKAREALRTAVVRGGAGPELALYGQAQLHSGDLRGAVRSLREAASHLPVTPSTLLTLAAAAERAGDRRTARDALERHVALTVGQPPSAVACRRLGDLSSAIGDIGRAVHWWRRAAETHADAPLLLRLAEAEAKIGEADRARATLDRVAALAPHDPRIARLRRQLGAS